MDKADKLLEMTGIHKSFSGVEVLHGVDFDIRCGEVHALMGENGAGKSTLVKILMGELKKDAGTIGYQNREIQINKPMDAHHYNLSMIHQELSLIPDMSITDNIFAGRELSRCGLVHKAREHRRAAEILKRIRLDIDPRTHIRDLRTAQMQMVEIAQAVSFGARIIVMDEPTSSISQKETRILFDIIRSLREQGISFVYITHRIEEVFEIANRVTVMRDGHRIGCESIENLNRDLIIKMMVGRELKDYFPAHEKPAAAEPVLEIQGFSRKREFVDVSLKLRPGEILGLAGLVGAGRTELASAIFGITQPDKGTLLVHNKKVQLRTPIRAIREGLALIPEDRKLVGLNQIGSVEDNILTLVESQYSRHGILDKPRRAKVAAEMIRKLSIKTRAASQPVCKLSGGNQQKVVLAKWLLRESDILILDEPTRGIDVGSRSEIYKLIVDMAKHGKAVLLISSDMPEVIGMCDRIAVLSEGRLAGILSKEEVTQEKIMDLASKVV